MTDEQPTTNAEQVFPTGQEAVQPPPSTPVAQHQVAEDTMSDEEFWGQQYKEATTGGNAQFLFFKDESTPVRLIGIGPRSNWFRDIESVYQGKASPRKMVLGYKLNPPGSKEETVLQAIIMTPTLWGKISQFAMQNWDFFTVEGGHGLNVTRQKMGRRVDYGAIPSPKPLPIQEDMLKAAEASDWDELVEAFKNMQEKKAQGDSGNAGDGTSVADQIINAADIGPASVPASAAAPW